MLKIRLNVSGSFVGIMDEDLTYDREYADWADDLILKMIIMCISIEDFDETALSISTK